MKIRNKKRLFDNKDCKIILDVKNINTFNKDGVQTLKDVSFTLKSGQILAVAGVSGNGQVEIADAIAGIETPVIEVHISNVYAREEYRHHSLMAKNCIGVIAGMGLHAYRLAVLHFMHLNSLNP